MSTISSSRTPDVSVEMKERLILDEQMTSDEEAEDSLEDEDSSVEEDETSQMASTGLPIASLPTGLCYDERMRYHSEVSATNGENVHPEDPRRIYYIFKELKDAGLVADGDDTSNVVVQQPLRRIDAREATEAECCLIHTQEHYDFVKSTASLSDEQLIDLSEDVTMDSIYFNSLSYFSSKLSAGGAIETCRAVVNRTVKNAIAVIRPPGHHAEVQSTMGFCLFNNVCIASKVCQADFGEQCRKILIVDWDVHHGNGCQKAFYDDPNILYISLHLHMDGRFYPSGPEGGMDRVGVGPGVGKNVNIPWPNKGMGDADYMYAFQHVVMPIANEFDPDLVVVASGFDAAAGDELGGCFVTPPCYAHMTHMLMSLANGKIAVCLEGGYNFRAISKSALAVTRTLMGEPPDRLEATQATLSAVETVEKVRQIQSRYWQSIYPKGRRDYDTKANLLIIFHDPPEVTIPPGRLSTLVSPGNAHYHDMVSNYIRQATSLDFGVIDVNIPVRITTQVPSSNELHTVPYASADIGIGRKQGVELASYLWVNYIEALVDRSTKTFLMGCGNAFHAVAGLISESETIYDSLEGVIGFIATSPVRPVSNASNPWVSSWYRENSRIYVSKAHSVWQKSGNLSRKYGTVVGSEGGTVVSIMQAEADDCWEWIKDKVEARDESTGNEMEVEDGDHRSRANNMHLIGLTGSIATGKSTTSQLLASAPYSLPIIDADVLARAAVEPGTWAYKQIVKTFGASTPDLLLPASDAQSGGREDGPLGKGRPLNRPALGRRVFGQTAERSADRQRLNAIVHPAVRLYMLRALAYYYVRGHWAVVLDIPLLFESGLDVFCSSVVVVAVSDPAIQMQRLRDRDPHLSANDALNRVRSQTDVLLKAKWASERGPGKGYVLYNDGKPADLELQLKDVMQKIAASSPRWWSTLLLVFPPLMFSVAAWQLLVNYLNHRRALKERADPKAKL
ncbi:hypothetical protein DV738_g4939, partial [Chaetothyriales sp. CBS 135597]